MLNPDTTTTKDFGMFFYLLRLYLDKWFYPEGAEVVITIKNVGIHLTLQAKNTEVKLNMKIIWLPPYWPHLAPVELVFGLIKAYIHRRSTFECLDYSKTSGKRIIIKGLEGLTTQIGRKMWTSIVKTASRIIIDANKDILREIQAKMEDGRADKELKLINK